MKNILASSFNPYRGLSNYTWLNLGAAFVNAGVSAIILFFVLYLTRQRGFSAFTAGTMITIFGVGNIIGSLSSGFLSDRFNPQLIAILSLLINALCLFAIPFVIHFYPLAIIVFIMGASNYAFSPANRTAMMEGITSYDEQARISGLRYMLYNLGIGAYAFVGGRLAVFGYSWIFLLSGISSMAIALVLLKNFLYKTHPSQPHSSATMTSGDEAPAVTSFLVWLYLGLLAASLIFAQLRITYPLYLHQYYLLDTRLLSNLFLMNAIMIVLLQMPILNLTQSIDAFMMSGLGIFLIGIGMGLLFLGSSYAYALILCMAWTAGEILYFSTTQTLLYDRTHSSTKGRHMGFYQSIIAVANIIGPLVGGWLYGFYQAKFLWLACLLLGIVGFIIHAWLASQETKE